MFVAQMTFDLFNLRRASAAAGVTTDAAAAAGYGRCEMSCRGRVFAGDDGLRPSVETR